MGHRVVPVEVDHGEQEVALGGVEFRHVVPGADVVVRVPVAIGADHPDLLAPQLVAEGLQGTDLVGDPVDARPPLGVLLDDRLPPEPARHAVDRHVFVGGVGVQPGVGVPLQEVEGLDDQVMVPVVRAEIQGPEDLRHHAAVMAL